MTALFDPAVKRGLLGLALLGFIAYVLPVEADVAQRMSLPASPAPAPTQAKRQLPQTNAPAVMQPAEVLLPPLAPVNLAIQDVNPTISKLTWNYPDGNLQRKLTAIEWSLCVGPGENCPVKTKAGPPQVNINDKNLGTFPGFPFDKVKNGKAIVGVKMCYLNALGSACARIDVPKAASMAVKQSLLPPAKASAPSTGVVHKGFTSGPNATGVAALNNGAINTAVVASPMAVNFGSVFSGDSRSSVVKVVSPRDGNATVTLAPNSPFSIVDVKVFGMVETKSDGATSKKALKQPVPPQLKAAGPSAAPSLVSNFSRSLLATSSSAPFTLATHEGNELVVSLVFAPKLDLVNGPPVGNHNSTLAINGGLWKTSVPVSGRFEGLKIGIVAVMSSPDIVVFTDKTGALTDAELVLTNTDKQPVTVEVSAKQLPPGFALTQLNIQLPAGKMSKATLPVTINSGRHEGAQQSAELTVRYSGTSKTVPFTFSVYPYEKQIHYAGEDGLQWEFWMTISHTGHTYYAYSVKNPNYMVTRRFWFDVWWKGMRLNTMANDVGNHFPGKRGDLVTYTWSTENNLVRDNYVQMLEDAPTVSMGYENH